LNKKMMLSLRGCVALLLTATIKSSANAMTRDPDNDLASPGIESGPNYMCNTNTSGQELVNRACFCGYLRDRMEVDENLPAITGSKVACDNGEANEYPCRSVDLMSTLPLTVLNSATSWFTRNHEANDIWGWTDPTTAKEYAIIGLYSGSAYIDITDAENPIYLGKLPANFGWSMWADIKTFGNYAFHVTESFGQGMQVFDLTQLRDVTEPQSFSATARYSEFSSCHNIFINEDTGYAYAVGTTTCRGGLHMINISNPLEPTFAGCYSDDGYTHDVQCVIYDGEDERYKGKEICFAENEDTITIVDVSDKLNPKELSSTEYSQTGYTHQGWLTEDHRFLIFGDELDEQRFSLKTTTFVFDVRDLENPTLAGIHRSSTNAIDHNLYVKSDFVYQANYRAGIRILKITDITKAEFEEVAFFDVHPTDDDAQFNGAWSVYPYFNSGNIIASSIERGLFVLKPNLSDSVSKFEEEKRGLRTGVVGMEEEN